MSTYCTFYLKCKQFWPFTIYVVINDKATEVEEEAVEHSIDKDGLYLRMEYTYISLYGIPEHVVSKFIVLGYNSTYFSNKIQKGKTCYSE
jgi:hypothetical protein